VREWPHQQFSDYIDAVMRAQGIDDDAELARRSGVGQTQIGRWRRGMSRPSIALLDRLAAGLLAPKRNLYALAGYSLDDEPVVVPPAVPREIQDLIDLYHDPDLTDEERANLLLQARLAVRGLRALMDDRRTADRGSVVRRRRAG
jgi:transcriptional regulator with XRE-family HTH domain